MKDGVGRWMKKPNQKNRS